MAFMVLRGRSRRAQAVAKVDSDYRYFSGGKAQLHGDDIKPKELDDANQKSPPVELPACGMVRAELDAG